MMSEQLLEEINAALQAAHEAEQNVDAAIKAFLKDRGIRLRTTCCGGRGNVDEAASIAGRAVW
jgi:hypothetical protein